jgi:cell division protein FtsI (penicillin-binding protein 3)
VKPRDQILVRLYVVLTVLGLVPVLVVGKMLSLHLRDGAALRAEGAKQAEAFVDIPAMRGAILDQAGRTLVVTTARYDVAVDPTIEGFSAQAEVFFDKLSKLTRVPAAELRQRLARRSSPRYGLLVRGVREQDKEAMETWEVPGLILDRRLARRYTYGRTAAHLLGHVDLEMNGLAGLEQQYDAVLRGQPGRRDARRDRLLRTKPYAGGQVVEPEDGQTLVLTLDLIRQTILEEELARGVAESQANWGTALAMDPRTGAVLAMASVPTYDPNQPGAYPVEAQRNRAIHDRYEPGSTFKLVTAIAALEQGKVALDDSIDTGPGWKYMHGFTLKDTRAHGVITFADVIAQSSNIGTAMVAERLDPGVFYQYSRNLGFGQPTLVDLPGEVDGRLTKPAGWRPGTRSSMSRGYALDATPLQVLTAYCALANGGLLVRPYLLAERRNMAGEVVWEARQDSIRRAFRSSTARTLLPVFERVVNAGTARLAQVEGLRIAGKTGTAMKVKDGAYSEGDYRASFVGFFPADDPQVALLVVLDEPRSSIYGGAVAAPVFQRTVRRWLDTFPRIAERLVPPDTLPPLPVRAVPAVAGLPLEAARSRLLAAGYQPDADVHPWMRVTAQQPAAGTEAAPGTPVRLTLADAAGHRLTQLPDLRGLTERQATFWLRTHRVAVRVEGTGVVRSQSPAAGAPLPRQVVLRCQ